MTTTLSRLLSLAADSFGKDAAALSAGDDFFEALGIDSMQAMDLLREIPDYELADVRTFEGLAEIIGRRL